MVGGRGKVIEGGGRKGESVGREGAMVGMWWEGREREEVWREG